MSTWSCIKELIERRNQTYAHHVNRKRRSGGVTNDEKQISLTVQFEGFAASRLGNAIEVFDLLAGKFEAQAWARAYLFGERTQV